MFKWYVYITAIILSFLVGHNNGYWHGYEAGQCVALPWQEQIKCWERIE